LFFPYSFLLQQFLNGLRLGCYLPIKNQDFVEHISILYDFLKETFT